MNHAAQYVASLEVGAQDVRPGPGWPEELQLDARNQLAAAGHPRLALFNFLLRLDHAYLGHKVGGASLYHCPGLGHALSYPDRGLQAVAQFASGGGVGRDEVGEYRGHQQYDQDNRRQQRQLAQPAIGKTNPVSGPSLGRFENDYGHGSLLAGQVSLIRGSRYPYNISTSRLARM